MKENYEDQLDRKELEYGSVKYDWRTETNCQNDGIKKNQDFWTRYETHVYDKYYEK